jgi:hypothetical protein
MDPWQKRVAELIAAIRKHYGNSSEQAALGPRETRRWLTRSQP